MRTQMFNEELKHSPKNTGGIFSPRFKSVAAMAGWDEETLLVASLVVEDTPDRESKYKKRSDSQFKTPRSNSRRKLRAQRSPTSVPVAFLDLDEEETSRKEIVKKKSEVKAALDDKEQIGSRNESPEQNSRVSYPSLALPCLDELRDELSCAICLEICFQPSTTPCGHSFCKKCLRSAADKCGKKCPKCRQLISNGRSCSVNTVLWNTIQLLFPQEVEARKAARALNRREAVCQNRLETAFHDNLRDRRTRASGGISRRDTSAIRRGNYILSQQEDAALLVVSRRGAESRSPERGGVYSNVRSRSTRPPSGIFGRDTRVRGRDGGDAALALRLQREEFGAESRSPERGGVYSNVRSRSTRPPSGIFGRDTRVRGRDGGDAALALRLQREEFMEAFRGNDEQSGSSPFLPSARANLRAMASRAVNLRIRRGWHL